MTRLKSKSASTCTRAWPGPTTEETIVFDLLAQALFECGLAFVGADAAGGRSSPAPSASSWPCSSTTETRSGFMPLTAVATR